LAFDERLGLSAFWLYNVGLVMWILPNVFPLGWPQLNAVCEHGPAYARSVEFDNGTLFWPWMRLPGDVVFYPRLVVFMTRRPIPPLRPEPGE
jgi:nitric oxide reductase subunit B